MQSLLWLPLEADPNHVTAACSLLWCYKFTAEILGSVQLMTILFILNVDNADYIMIAVFHSHTCRGSKIDREPTRNDGEIPTKVKLGASYKLFPEELESAECKDNFLSFLVFIQVQNMWTLA